jgi:hypothetical protein
VVARVWVAKDETARLARRVVTLGAPLHGTVLAAVSGAFAPGACPVACQQLAPGSALLRELGGEPLPARLPWLSIWTEDDQTGPAARIGAAGWRGERFAAGRVRRGAGAALRAAHGQEQPDHAEAEHRRNDVTDGRQQAQGQLGGGERDAGQRGDRAGLADRLGPGAEQCHPDRQRADDDQQMEAIAPMVPISPSTIWIGRCSQPMRVRAGHKTRVSRRRRAPLGWRRR